MNLILDAVKCKVRSTNLEKNFHISGRVSKFDGVMISCDGFPANIGTLCSIETDNGQLATGEIVGFKRGENILSVYESGARIKVGAKVQIKDVGTVVKVGPGLLGRVIDALGDPLDEKESPKLEDEWPLLGRSINPLLKKPISEPLDVGVRVINSVISIGKGQRVGIIAGSGVGKSVLLGMMTKFTEADIIVVGLIGERGREVGNFVNSIISSKAKSKTIIVAVPADRSPLLRIRGANRATAIAEYFREQGKNVLLIMDSLTRVAHAQREIGLGSGEQPTSKGYPPSVVSLIPRLIERSGTGKIGEGSITAFYTVLADGDDNNDPVVDAARAILDGHIVLSRQQSLLGIYPAVDVPNSISRVMNEITDGKQQKAAIDFKKNISLYLDNRDLLLMGGYSEGQDEDLDKAISMWPDLVNHISQKDDVGANYSDSKSALIKLLGE